jgi:uncharacterized protein YegL
MILYFFTTKKIILFSIYFLSFLVFNVNCNAQKAEGLQSVLCLVDVSGSMKGQKIDSVKSATKKIINMLLPCNTEISILAYSGKSDKPIKFYKNFTTNKSELLSFVDSLQPEGNTPLGAALKSASYSFKNNKNPKSVKQTIILLCDGRSDDNISNALKELKEKKSLIQCECIGFDIENDKQAEAQLKQIAHETTGEYYSATNVTNVIKAFLKSSIKTIIHDIPVVVRKSNGRSNFQPLSGNVYKLLTNQYWTVDSIQVNISEDMFDLTKTIADENMQDTLPKSIVFDNSKIVSLFINNGSTADANQKWIDGKYLFDYNSLTLNIQNHYLKLIIKQIERNSMVLCVNKYKDVKNDMIETEDEVCDCNNKMKDNTPYIYVYFSKAGCGQ